MLIKVSGLSLKEVGKESEKSASRWESQITLSERTHTRRLYLQGYLHPSHKPSTYLRRELLLARDIRPSV